MSWYCRIPFFRISSDQEGQEDYSLPCVIAMRNSITFGCASCGGLRTPASQAWALNKTSVSRRARAYARARSRAHSFTYMSHTHNEEEPASSVELPWTAAPTSTSPSHLGPSAKRHHQHHRHHQQQHTSNSSTPTTAPNVMHTHNPSPNIKSLTLNLNGRDALPSVASLMRYMRDLRPKLDYLGPRARERVLSALEVANVAHEGQKRKSGDPYIIHPIAVAAILAEMHMDRDSIIAGLLHDTVEDTPFTLEEIEMLFGNDVRKIVEGETKISKLASKVQQQRVEAAGDEEEEASLHRTFPGGAQKKNRRAEKSKVYKGRRARETGRQFTKHVFGNDRRRAGNYCKACGQVAQHAHNGAYEA